MLRIDEHITFVWNDDGGDVERSGAVAGNAVIAQPDAGQAIRFGIPSHRWRVDDATRIVYIVRYLDPDQVAIQGRINEASVASALLLTRTYPKA
jgi:hypothetical protein